MNKIRDNKKGGGICIGVDKRLNYEDLGSEIPDALNENLELLLARVVHPDFEVFILNVYINNY